ncbi:MAG TPA: hypothetical protein VH558_07175 [Pseudolabrys sp.]|jgi:hypothetical protein
MKRNEFIVALGGAMWPMAAHAQQARIAKLDVLLVGSHEPRRADEVIE